MRHVIHFTDSIDRWWVRAAPVPLDVRMMGAQELEMRDTPYLDAQFNFPLLLLALFCSARVWGWGRRGSGTRGAGMGLWVVSWLLFAVALVCSVSPRVFGWLPGFFHGLQFAYRLVSYQNLALLGAVASGVALISSRQGAGRHMPRPAVLMLCGGIGVLGLVLKLIHASAAMHGLLPDSRQWREDRNDLLHVPHEFYGWPAYAVLGRYATNCEPAEAIFFPLRTGPRFGEVAPARFEVAKAQEVILQVQPFPWNRIRLDGQPLAEAERCRRANGVVVGVEAGPHEAVYEWVPDPLWAGLSVVSRWALLVWVSLAVTWRVVHRQAQAVTLARPSR